MHQLYNQILAEIRSAWRFRWLALATAWVVCLGGWVWAAQQPDVYQANARVYVDTSSELGRLLGGQIVETDVNAQLAFVRQAMLGRTYLEALAEKLGMLSEDAGEAQRQGVVDQLRGRLEVQSAGAVRNAPDNIYRLAYSHGDRQRAVQVVSTLLDIFVEDTMSARQSDSESARRFLEQQVQEYEGRLAEAETRLANFKRENYDRLPGTEGGYFERLQRETDLLEDARKELELVHSRRDRIQQRLSGDNILASTDLDFPDLGMSMQNETPLAARLREAEARLEELLLRYTERHPDVIAMRQTLAELRERRATEVAAMARMDGGSAALSSNPVYQALQIHLNEVEVEMAALEADVADREQRVQRLRSLINEVPEVEAQLARLDRDYEVVRSQYQSLVQSLERERLSREAEQSNQVEFRVIDPPVAAFEPVAPDRPRLFSMVFIGALMLGGGSAFVAGQLRPVFQTPTALSDFTGRPVIGAISMTWKARRRIREYLGLLMYAGAALTLLLAFGGVLAYELYGWGIGLDGLR